MNYLYKFINSLNFNIIGIGAAALDTNGWINLANTGLNY